MAAPAKAATSLAETTPEGRLRLHFHRGQYAAWSSEKRLVTVLAGTQGGKTTFGPYWLWREIQRRGPGDYMVVTPTYPLLQKKVLPEFLRLFKRQLRLGEYQAGSRTFLVSPDGSARLHGAGTEADEVPTQVFFGHAQDPESLESATAKAAWLDEAGQKRFRLGSWEAIQRRLAIHQGRVLITTTPYDLGWLKQLLFDPWAASKRSHPEIDVVRFDSTENPAFPQAEFERARANLPRWKFDLFYRAIFTRPPGMIYDCFDSGRDTMRRFPIPPTWRRILGLDFGGVNTGGCFYAVEEDGRRRPTGRLILYRTYRAGSRSAAEHVAALMEGEPRIADCWGGAKSEDQWRREFTLAGLPVRQPVLSEVEVGIDRVYSAHMAKDIVVFSDLADYLDEKLSYSRELDDAGEPTDKIEAKESYHLMDAERYGVGSAYNPGGGAWNARPNPASLSMVSRAPAGVFDVEVIAP